MLRLQKFMAQAGVASRRASEQMIKDGRVEVNGERVTEVGLKIDPDKDTVKVDGRLIKENPKIYIMLNKPKGYVSSKEDKHAEKLIYELIPEEYNLHSIGRLDKDTTGLILLTNDGELTQLLTHPARQAQKTYEALVKGKINQKEVSELQKGVDIPEDDGSFFHTSPAEVKVLGTGNRTSRILITISEGRKRQVRKMCEAVGHEVIELKRIKEKDLSLGDLKEGKWRFLTDEEVNKLKND